MLECTFAFLAINQSLGYSLNLNHLFSRIFVLGMMLISLNLIACSSSGGGGESTPAADNGDDGDDTPKDGGDTPAEEEPPPPTPTDVGTSPCMAPMNVPDMDPTKNFFYLVKYIGGGSGANAPTSEGAKHLFSVYRKDIGTMATTRLGFATGNGVNDGYIETLTFADSEHFKSVVITIGATTPFRTVVYERIDDNDETFSEFFGSAGSHYYSSSTANCTDANEYFEFNSGSGADKRCFAPNTIPDVTPPKSDVSFRAFIDKALTDASYDTADTICQQ